MCSARSRRSSWGGPAGPTPTFSISSYTRPRALSTRVRSPTPESTPLSRRSSPRTHSRSSRRCTSSSTTRCSRPSPTRRSTTCPRSSRCPTGSVATSRASSERSTPPRCRSAEGANGQGRHRPDRRDDDPAPLPDVDQDVPKERDDHLEQHDHDEREPEREGYELQEGERRAHAVDRAPAAPEVTDIASGDEVAQESDRPRPGEPKSGRHEDSTPCSSAAYDAARRAQDRARNP